MLFAYIDPALGSMLLQAVAGVIVAAMVIGRRFLMAPIGWLSAMASAVALLMFYARVVIDEIYHRVRK
jgi:hypothetical protein